MTVAAGIDVGNATTEVVLGRLTPAGVEVLAADRVPTRRAKGTPESLAAAAALVRRLERRHGVRVQHAAAAPLRRVATGSASVPEDRPPTGRLRELATEAQTTGGQGFGVGRPVRLGEDIAYEERVVVVVPTGHRYDQVAAELQTLSESGRLAGVLLEDDEAVLVANRMDNEVPVLDQVDPDSVLGACRVAVEVSADGRPLRVLNDPLKLATALGLPAEELADAAALAARLQDTSSAAVALADRAPESPAPAVGWIEFADSRLSFPAGHERVRSGRVGEVRAYALPPDLRVCPVDDLWAVDLADVAGTVVARRAAADKRPVVLAALQSSDYLTDPAQALAGLLDLPVTTAASEASAARAGALTTPGAPREAAVVDIGGGTLDVVSPHAAIVAAGAGDLLSVGVADLTGASVAAAEWVKRGQAHRVEAPQVLLGEHGDRVFLDKPAPRDSIGSLVVRGPAGLLAFSSTMAPGEWRALRLRLKTDLVGGNVLRALRSLGSAPSTVVVVGGSAGDDEVLASVAGALPAGTAIGRGDVGGSLGHRYAVAYGLLLDLDR